MQGPANFLHCSSICMTNSLVGARTNTIGPSPGCNKLRRGNNYLRDSLVVDMHDGRQHESKGFPRTSLSNTNHIPSRKSNRPALTLNTGWLNEILLRQSISDIFGETCLFEYGHWLRDVVTLHCHLVFISELSDFLLVSGSNVLVFLQTQY